MPRLLVTAIATCALALPAFADSKPSDEEAKKIAEAITAVGCEGGKIEKETEGTGAYEVDDAKCKSGQYDIKLDKDFKVLSLTRD